MKISKNHISSLLKITKHFLGLDESVLSKCKFCAMFYLVEFDDKKNSLSVCLDQTFVLCFGRLNSNFFSLVFFLENLRHLKVILKLTDL